MKLDWLISLAVLTSLFWLWQQPLYHYNQPPFWLISIGVGSLLLLAVKLPLLAWLWWGIGLLTMIWSLTPSNTLVVGLWELVYLAGFAAGTWLAGLLGLNVLLLSYGLLTTLAMASTDIFMFFSGSAHYVAGAQALLLIPTSAALMFRSRWQLMSGILLSGALYLALMSGSRAVYLPLVLMGSLLIWRLWRGGVQLWRIGVGLGGVTLIVMTIDFALPFSPIQNALNTKASISRQVSDFAPEGGWGSRLLMWDQTLSIAVKEPLGTGNGSFRDVLAAYQKYPSLLFANAHNYYFETAATGGWPRLIVLVCLLGWILWRGWQSKAWPWALGTAGLWATLAFDITGMYPAVMALAFAGLGAVYGQLPPKPILVRNQALWVAPGLLLAVGLVGWWYWPCPNSCAATRHLGYRPEVTVQLKQLSRQEQGNLLDQAIQFNPKSIWVYRIQLQYAPTPEDKLQTLRAINRNFPLAGPWFYLQQAELARQLGLDSEATQALRSGLIHFPADFRPAGIPLGDTIYKQYEEWTQKAPELLKELGAQ